MNSPVAVATHAEVEHRSEGQEASSDGASMENDGERPAAESSAGKKESKKWTDEEDNVLIRILLDDLEVCVIFPWK